MTASALPADCPHNPVPQHGDYVDVMAAGDDVTTAALHATFAPYVPDPGVPPLLDQVAFLVNDASATT